MNALQKKFPLIADVRGSGLFIGVEIIDESQNPNTELAAYIKNKLRAQHILVSTDGPYNNVIKIKPPLAFTKKDADILIAAIAAIF